MRKSLFITLLITAVFAQANPPLAKWKCFAFDFYGESFQGLGKTQRLAMHDARKNCLQHAGSKTHCKTAQSYCEKTLFSENQERCSSVDGSGKVFNATGPESCDVAMSLCDEWQYLHGNSQKRSCHIIHR